MRKAKARGLRWMTGRSLRSECEEQDTLKGHQRARTLGEELYLLEGLELVGSSSLDDTVDCSVPGR